MLGSGYVIEHCISAFKRMQEEKSYKIYVSDALQCIAKNTTHFVTFNGVEEYGTVMQERWIDLISGRANEPEQEEETEEDTRTTDEIVSDIWKNMIGKGAR